MTNIIRSFEEFQALPVGSEVEYRGSSRYEKVGPGLWKSNYTTLDDIDDESFRFAISKGFIALTSKPQAGVVEIVSTTARGYDFNAGDERFGSREEAVDRAVVRSETRGRQRVRPYSPFLDGGEQTWLVQDA